MQDCPPCPPSASVVRLRALLPAALGELRVRALRGDRVQVQDVREGFLEEVVAVSAGTRDDWILWGAVGCALVGTAHSEWSLAVAVGAHPWVATVVPGALDLYVVRALRMHRDVFLAVLAMVA